MIIYVLIGDGTKFQQLDNKATKTTGWNDDDEVMNIGGDWAPENQNSACEPL